MKKEIFLALSLVAAGSMLYGCGTNRQNVQSEMDNSAHPESHHGMRHYTVKKKDTLWAIAAKRSVYGDAFEWPALYKENRDKITDPDLIYPDQTFQYVQRLSLTQKKDSEKLADETPKYEPHDKPRQKLPVDYF